jgi:hypothetical protein
MATPTSLPATFVAGNVLTAAQMNDLRGAFRVLQIVEGSTTTETSSSTTTFADTTLSATITPSATSSKILVYVSHAQNIKTATSNLSGLKLKLVRGSTDIYTISTFLGYTGTSIEMYFPAHGIYLDSPATTSATTYKTQFANSTAASLVNVQQGSVRSTILLMEISA